MSVTFEIFNISIEELNETESMILINFFFECKEKNLTWKFDKPYEILESYFNILSSKIPDIPHLPSLFKKNIVEQNYKEQFIRLDKALRAGFNLEAIFIEYAILEDRTSSILRYENNSIKPRGNRPPSLDAKLRKIKTIAREKKSLRSLLCQQ